MNRPRPIHFIKELLLNIQKIFYWLPIIWRDRWWDESFLLKILEAKLRYNAKWFEKHGCHVRCEKDAHQMKIAAALCKRLYKQEYTTPWDKEAQESGRRLFEYIEGHEEMFGNGMKAYTSRGYVEDKHLHDCSMWASEHEDEMKIQDLELLCKILREQLFEWWD